MSKPTLPNLNRPGMQTLQKQHDAVSKSINRVLLVLIGFSLFCVLTLGAEDASLLRTDATITMPFAGTRISFVAFLVIGPTVLIALTGYLHVLVGYWNSLGGRQYKGALPQIQNIRAVGAVVVSGYLLYWLTPTVLAVFAWKALPRPEGPWLVAVSSFVAAFLAWLQISRCKANYLNWLKWIWLSVPITFMALSVVQGYHEFTRPPPMVSNVAATIIQPLFKQPLLERRLRLRGADLSNRALARFSLKNADLSFANLSKVRIGSSDFTNANLSYANLTDSRFSLVWFTDANLEGANLAGVQLTAVVLLGANLQRANLAGAQFFLSLPMGADFQGANLVGARFSLSSLKGANLRDADLSDADLRVTDGLTCEQLTEAKRWWEAGRADPLSCGRDIPKKFATIPTLLPRGVQMPPGAEFHFAPPDPKKIQPSGVTEHVEPERSIK